MARRNPPLLRVSRESYFDRVFTESFPSMVNAIDFWIVNDDWDITTTNKEERKYLSWGTQAILRAFYFDALDPRRSENERRLLSCLLFIHLLDGYYPEGLGSRFSRSYLMRNPSGIFGKKPWQIPLEERQSWALLGSEVGSDWWRDGFTDEEREKINNLFRLRENMVQVWVGSNLESGVPTAAVGGSFTGIRPRFVSTLLKYVWDMETHGHSETTISERFYTSSDDWRVDTLPQINSNKNVFLNPFGRGRKTIINTWNYRQTPFVIPLPEDLSNQ